MYKIKGDYMDCQLYDGNLFLWTYSGELKIYNFRKLICELEKRKEISENTLRLYQIGTVERMDTRFPTDSEVYGDKYYITSRNGLYQSGIKELEQGFQKVWDCPLLSISAKSTKGLTMAGGAEGVFVYSEVDAIRDKYGMKDSKITKVSGKHANYSAFCSKGLYATSVLEESYYLKLYKHSSKGELCPTDKIFPDKNVLLSWSYRDKLYGYFNDKISIKRIVRKNSSVKFEDYKEYCFYPQKGKVLAGMSTDFADIIELENALVIFPIRHSTEDTKSETIWGPITRWRAFPKSYGYNNIIMIVLEDELMLYLMESENGLYRTRSNVVQRNNR